MNARIQPRALSVKNQAIADRPAMHTHNQCQPSQSRFKVALVLATALVCATPALQAGEWNYRVQRGESLWTISQNHLTGTRWALPLQRLNAVRNPHALEPGSQLRVPLAWTRRTAVEARIEAVTGQAQLRSANGSVQALSVGQRISTGDVIITGAGGHVTLRFPEGSVTRLFPQSEVKLDELELLGNSAQMMARLNVSRGRSENIVRPGSLVRHSQVLVRTPFATTSVRGTHFRVGASEEDGASTGVLEGAVDVTGSAAGSRAVAVPPNLGVVAKADGRTLPPRQLLPAPSLASVDSQQQYLPLQITVDAVAGAASYIGELAADEQFDQVLYSAMADTPTLQWEGVSDGAYWLRVRGVDADGLEGLDASRQLHVDSQPAAPATLTLREGQVQEGGSLRFTWESAPAASQYEMRVLRLDAHGQPQGQALYSQSTPQTHVQTHLFAPNTGPVTLGWQVRMRDADGKQGPFGRMSTFVLAPSAPGLTAVRLDGSQMTLSWTQQPFARQWQVQLARSPDFANPVVDELTSRPELSTQRLGRGHYLRLRWIDADGLRGPWSLAQEFSGQAMGH